MKILTLKLTGYKRIALSGYENIEIDFTNKKIQLILGDNGSGKSSLIRECSPFPIKSADVFPNGGKEVLIQEGNETYRLSNYRGGQCSFIRLSDEQELNPGGTQPIQKELIKQIFNYTTEIHSLMVGDELFTEMRPMRRKEWVTKLSDVSYDYALKVFGILKEKYRDTVGAVKIANKKLVDAADDKPTTETENKLQTDITKLQAQINQLSDKKTIIKRTTDCDTGFLFSEMQDGCNELVTIFRDCGYLLKKDTEHLIGYHTGALATIKNEKEKRSKLVMTKQDKLRELRSLGVANTEDIRSRQQKLSNEILAAKGTLVLGLEINSPEDALGALEANISTLSLLFDELPENSEKRYTVERKIKGEEALANVIYALNETKNNQDIKLKEIDHLESHKEDNSVTCPKCDFHFNPTYSEDKVNRLKQQTIELGNRIGILTKKRDKIQEEVNDINDYLNKYNDFTLIVRATRSMMAFWNYLADTKIVTGSPKQVPVLLNKLKFDLNVLLNIKKKEKELVELDKLLQTVSTSDNKTILQFEEDLKIEEDKYSQLIEQERKEQKTLDLLYREDEMKKRILFLRESLENDLNKVVTSADENIREAYQKALNQSIIALQVALGEASKQLNDMYNRRNILKNMEDTLAKLKEEASAYKLLMDCLSPNDGLIAKGLFGFIKHQVNIMNELIGRVWCYPMLIHSPKMDEDSDLELDYRYPFEVLTDANNIPDVGLGSKGQKEIIDLAFRIFAGRCLHIEEMPIWADEFGTGLDETHRKRAADAIKTIINEENYSQLFMISHYDDTYGSLLSADVCVLSGNNIKMPQKHNQHVQLS